jgi:phage protein D
MIGNPLFASATGYSPAISRPQFRLASSNGPLPLELMRACSGVSIKLAANRPGSFSLAINDPKMRWIRASDGPLQEGQRIDIALGYGQDMRPVFSGSIVSVGADLDDGGGFMIHVQGFDALHEASRESDYERFLDQESDSVIIAKIAAGVLGLPNSSIVLKGGRSRPRFKQNVSALQFLEELAGEYGCMFWVENETLYFRPEREGGLPVELRRGIDLISLSVRLSTAGQVAEVEARSSSTSQKTQIVAVARASVSFPGIGKLSAAGVEQTTRGASGNARKVLHANIDATTQEEAQRYAEAELRRLRMNLVTGDGATIGNPEIRVGTVLSFSEADLGRFHGHYFVDSVRHDLNESGYRTSFQMRQIP